ncbi:MAG TPA: glycosyltransferase family 4 protein [bacterium]|nr:glycosyltransferase family 4 protein [bacterium]HQG45874.1 glycosyltransferase family 4 protein [bacterium]HQI47250.1 glycosyltransferase family 4 protein [bacterium]HQJ64241.1 glycosyltransferase family 4 protein [bacterium]
MTTYTLPPVPRKLRILMIAPQPWFQPRGTPFSVLHRIKALTLLGHEVDLVTYPIGTDVVMPGLQIHRAAGVPGIHQVKIGPSKAKILLDAVLWWRARQLAARGGYNLLHTHEEAGFFGVWLARRHGLPHLYDMHSSLPQQLHNFRYSQSRLLVGAFERLEACTINQAAAVITICPELQRYVEEKFPDKTSLLIENVGDNAMVFPPAPGDAARLRAQYGLGEARIILYYGTLEAYQGIPLLIESAARLLAEGVPGAATANPPGEGSGIKFLLVGGSPEQVEASRALARQHGVADHFVFTGFVQPQQIPGFIEIAEVLVSPRLSGTNSPLKIYSYLRSGRVIVATRHITHTQILNDEVAILTDVTPEGFAAGIRQALTEGDAAARRITAAAALAEKDYSYSEYLRRVQWIVSTAAGV